MGGSPASVESGVQAVMVIIPTQSRLIKINGIAFRRFFIIFYVQQRHIPQLSNGQLTHL